MRLIVNPHKIKLVQDEAVNEKEINVSECVFEFADEITDNFVKEALFTLEGNTYKQIIVNNRCKFPQEVLVKEGTVELGVVAYLVENQEEIVRYNPTPIWFKTDLGSLKDAQNSEPITPSEMEQYEQALQDGLTEVNSKLDDIDEALTDVNIAITETNNLDLDVTKEGKTATVELTKKDGTTKTVTLSDGTNLMFNWDGTSLGIKTDEDADYTYVDLQGVQGETGPMGAPFTIKKTYSSVAEMNADFYNMNVGDYVMIASTVEVEDNAKLYTRGEEQWIFISDFSGAQGIKGETGATPNIQIGTVTSGATPSVTRTGTNENPVLNFTLVKGDKGDTGSAGPTGNGIASIEKTSTSGLVDTYTITYTDGTTSTFTVTNGEVSQAQLDETNRAIDYYKTGLNALPKQTTTGTSLTINDTVECPMPLSLAPSEIEQWNLPDGYTQVEYLQSTGTQYIDTGVNADSTLRVEIDMQYVEDTTAIAAIGAIYNNDGEYTRYHWGTSGQDNRFYYDSHYKTTIRRDTARHYLVADLPNYKTYVDGTSYDLITGEFNTNLNFWLFGRNSNVTDTSSTGKMKIYSSKIYKLGVIIRNFIPCYRNSDNVGGLYDTVNKVFYTNAGTGDFTYGSIVSTISPDYPQDIHVVSGDNEIKVEPKNLFNLTDDLTGYNRTNNIVDISENKLVMSGASGLSARLIRLQNFEGNKQYTASYNSIEATGRFLMRLRSLDDTKWLTSSDITLTGWSYNTTYGAWAKDTEKTSGTTYQHYLVIDVPNCLYWQLGIVNAYTRNQTFTNIQLERGNQVTSYIPYQGEAQILPLDLADLELCKMPNTNYEDKFVKANGTKNKFDFNYFYSNYVTVSGSTVGRLSLKLKPNTQYTASTNTYRISGTQTYSSTFIISGNDTSFSPSSTSNGFRSGNPRTITTDAEGYVTFGMYISGDDAISINDFINGSKYIQIEEGTTATQFEPCNDGKWYLMKNTGKKILDGTENWLVGSYGTNSYTLPISNLKNATNITNLILVMCDKFTSVSYTDRSIETNNIVYVDISSDNGVYFRNTEQSSVEDWEIWLSTHNTTIYYVLSKPTYIQLNDTLQSQLDEIYEWALSYEGQTNITQTNNDLPFVITATTIKLQTAFSGDYNDLTNKPDLSSYATELYVDNAIADAITDTLGGSF